MFFHPLTSSPLHTHHHPKKVAVSALCLALGVLLLVAAIAGAGGVSRS